MILTILIYTKAYRIKRLLTFLNPWLDPLGNGFQNIQSLVAIHNGGFFGLGIGNSIQKNFFLPMAHTDFIFSIIVEEIGLVGAGILLIKMLSFSYFFILESNKNVVIFEKYYLLSTGTLFFLQIIINTGAATALLPTKGIGFPAISYGLSSFLGISLLIGIALCFLD
jgi:cell division protein FtsW